MSSFILSLSFCYLRMHAYRVHGCMQVFFYRCRLVFVPSYRFLYPLYYLYGINKEHSFKRISSLHFQLLTAQIIFSYQSLLKIVCLYPLLKCVDGKQLKLITRVVGLCPQSSSRGHFQRKWGSS